jgi:hypothetical protein
MDGLGSCVRISLKERLVNYRWQMRANDTGRGGALVIDTNLLLL